MRVFKLINLSDIKEKICSTLGLTKIFCEFGIISKAKIKTKMNGWRLVVVSIIDN